MDITPHQFNALLNELKKIREHLEELHKQQIAAVDAAKQREENKRDVQPIWLDAILAKYKQPEADRKTEGKQQYSVHNSARWAAWFTFGATLLAFGAAAVYAHYAHQTLTEIQKQTPEFQNTAKEARIANEDARKRFRDDERPYIWLKVYDQQPKLIHETTGPKIGFISLAFSFTDYGRSPANNVRGDYHLAVGERECRSNRLLPVANFGSVFTPNEPNSYNIAYSWHRIDDSTFSSILSGDTPVCFYGVFKYTDIYAPEITYTSEFCQTPLFGKVKLWPYCAGRNKIR